MWSPCIVVLSMLIACAALAGAAARSIPGTIATTATAKSVILPIHERVFTVRFSFPTSFDTIKRRNRIAATSDAAVTLSVLIW